MKAKLKQSSEIFSNKLDNSLKNSIEIKKQINKKETNDNNINFKTITINEVNKMISNTNYFAGPCSFVFENKISTEKSDNQGLLIIYKEKLFCIKTPIQNNMPMKIIQEISLINMKDIKMKDQIFCYINNNKQNEENIIIKFNSELDAEKFLESFKKAQKNA